MARATRDATQIERGRVPSWQFSAKARMAQPIATARRLQTASVQPVSRARATRDLNEALPGNGLGDFNSDPP